MPTIQADGIPPGFREVIADEGRPGVAHSAKTLNEAARLAATAFSIRQVTL